MPTLGMPDAMTAAPQPAKTSQNVPRNSAPGAGAVQGLSRR